MYFLGFFFLWGFFLGRGESGALYIPSIPIYIPKTTPTVPEFKAFKGFADISQSFGAIFRVPSGPPRGRKREKSGKPGIGKMPKMGKIAPREPRRTRPPEKLIRERTWQQELRAQRDKLLNLVSWVMCYFHACCDLSNVGPQTRSPSSRYRLESKYNNVTVVLIL